MAEEKLLTMAQYAKKHRMSRQWVQTNVDRLMNADNHKIKKSMFKREDLIVVQVSAIRIRDSFIEKDDLAKGKVVRIKSMIRVKKEFKEIAELFNVSEDTIEYYSDQLKFK